ncbi:MAG: DUF4926 domain-containing protein [Ignavibacteria bacterium]|nr:DUF4926 domain-containing protein [Ignavibacteria bacterium]
MFNELDTIVLAKNIHEHHLTIGDVGAIVYKYENADAYEVEFVTAEGNTVAVVTLEEKDIRPMEHNEILHVRELLAA